MPKSGKGKGGKNRRRGKRSTADDFKRELILKEDGQEYARVEKKPPSVRTLQKEIRSHNTLTNTTLDACLPGGTDSSEPIRLRTTPVTTSTPTYHKCMSYIISYTV
mmetsp:Transcript_1476/g.2516  ORF Transcript_1476/g.2516 Transcript_1476/m.2516 type:complete len:106 (+) Transcript_1476:91-408(+)